MALLGVLVPPQWGGAGLDYLSMAVALEELAAGDGAVSDGVLVQQFGGVAPLLQV